MKPAPRQAPKNCAAPELLEQAITWAVRLGSGSADAAAHAAWGAWRAAHPAHEAAWQQVQAIEDTFRQVPPVGGTGNELAHGALQAATRLRGQGRRRTLGLLGMVAASGILGLVAWREKPWLERALYATEIGERRRVVLADGTELNLDTASEAQVVFSPLRRLIVLHRGQLFIRTGADERAMFGRRAFWVQAPHARFEALGTRFGVRLDDAQTRLSMTEGRVAIHLGDAPPVIAQAGEDFVVRTDASEVQRVVDRSFDSNAWAEGAMVAKQMRLDAFVAELARYRRAPLHCSAEVASMQVSGVFQFSGPDPVGRALEALMRSLPLALEHGPDDALTVTRR